LAISFIKGQESGTFTGLDAYEHLKAENLLAGCLGLADGHALVDRGVRAFSKFFEAKESAIVALWTAVFKDDDGKICVPMAIPVRNKVILTKADLSVAWTKYRPLVRFA
jgi:hypothetical protein